MPHNYETALSVVTLGGSIIGQVGFGLGADFWGRRKMYVGIWGFFISYSRQLLEECPLKPISGVDALESFGVKQLLTLLLL